jgi:hypothetical protein
VEHPKVDRVVVDPGRHEDVTVTEVYYTVTEEGGGEASVGWRSLGLAIALFATAVVLSVTVLGSDRSPGRASSAGSTLPATGRSAQVSRPAAATPSHACVNTAGYGGLGARASAFSANNNASTGPAEPTPGTAWYAVTATERGCVTAFSLQDGGAPPVTARYLLLLVSYPYLPRDARRVVNLGTCAVWNSATLRRATGKAYATATAIAQVGSMPGRAQIETTVRPSC